MNVYVCSTWLVQGAQTGWLIDPDTLNTFVDTEVRISSLALSLCESVML
jgi:hypothetical protein